METNLHLDKKTEISSPIKDAIASHIEKFYPAPKVQGDAGSPTSLDNEIAVNNSNEDEAGGPVKSGTL